MKTCLTNCEKCTKECKQSNCRCPGECSCASECVQECLCKMAKQEEAREKLVKKAEEVNPLPFTILAGSVGNFCCSCDNHTCCECCSEHQTSTTEEKKRIKIVLLDEIVKQHNSGDALSLHAKQVLLSLVSKLNLD